MISTKGEFFNKLLIACIIILFICTFLIGARNINSHRYIKSFLCIMLVEFTFLVFILINFRSSLTILIFNLISYYLMVISCEHLNIKNFSNNKNLKYTVIISLFLLLLILINIIVICIKANNYNKDIKMVFIFRVLFPLLSFFFLLVTVIVCFAIIYHKYNLYAIRENLPEGLFYTNDFMSYFKEVINISEVNSYFPRALGAECFYFSSATLFTVGYGDVIPLGNKLKITVQIEMFVGSLLTYIIFPALLLVITGSLMKNKDNT